MLWTHPGETMMWVGVGLMVGLFVGNVLKRFSLPNWPFQTPAAYFESLQLRR